MKSFIELEYFAAGVVLPEGIRFKEWQEGNITAVEHGTEEFTYIDSHMMALERISDGKLSTFNITDLRNPRKGILIVPAADLATAVDKAILELQGR